MKDRILREPMPIKVTRGGKGSGWENPGADHHVYEYRSDPDPDGPLWSREVRPRHRKLFVTRSGYPALIPESGTHDQINSASDQFTPGVIEVDGTIYLITVDDGPTETEKPTMPMTPYILVMTPEPRLYPENEAPAGKSYRIAMREDLEALTTEQLLTLFRVVLPPERHARYTFPSKTVAVDYTWNAWLIIVPKLLPGYEPSPEPDRAQRTKPVARTVKKNDGEVSGKVLTRTPLGIGARRKEGTRRTESWNVIRDGMSYVEYITAGGSAEDLNIIIRLGHVTLE